MGALPKRKISKQRKNQRRSHLALVLPKLTRDPKTGMLLPRHSINPVTGEYRGKKLQKPV